MYLGINSPKTTETTVITIATIPTAIGEAAEARNEILNGPLLDCFDRVQSLHDNLIPPGSQI